MKFYYPYKSDKPEKKYYIITNTNKKIYFGAAGYEDFTITKDEEQKKCYIARHKNESKFWNDPNTASFWAFHYLWHFPTKKEAYENIKKIYFIKK